MRDGALVVDPAVHAYNFAATNVAPHLSQMSEAFLKASYGLHAMLSPEGPYRLRPEEVLRDCSATELAQLLFLESDVDVAVYHSLPLDDLFADGLASLDKGVELRRRAPHRVRLYAAINPLEGPAALDKMERYVRELGVIGIKVYPARFVGGETIPVRLDDPRHGLPVIEKAIDLGVRCVAVHKYFPVGPTRLGPYNVDDVEVAGRYPELNFEVLHPGFAFADETAWLLARYPNVYVNLEWTVSLLFRAPRRFAEVLGQLLYWGGEDRLFWSSGAGLVHPQAALDAFMAFRMPEDLVDGYGLPALTESGKRKLLGANYCRLHGLDVDALTAAVRDDAWTGRAASGRPEPWSLLRGEGATVTRQAGGVR